MQFQCVAASIERAREHWFDAGPLADAGPRLRRGAGHPAAGRDRRRALHRRRDRQQHPRQPRARSSGRRASSCCTSAGSTGRSSRRDGPGRSGSSRSRSPAGTGSSATWPRCRTASRCMCCRPGSSTRRASPMCRSSAIATPRSAGAHRARRRGVRALSRGTQAAVKAVTPTLVRRMIVAPLIAVAEAVMIVVSPLLAIVAVIVSPLTGGWRALRLLASSSAMRPGISRAQAPVSASGSQAVARPHRGSSARTTRCCAGSSEVYIAP